MSHYWENRFAPLPALKYVLHEPESPDYGRPVAKKESSLDVWCQHCINTLLKFGYSLPRIAKETGISQNTLQRIHLHAQKPRHSTFVRVLRLYCRLNTDEKK